MKFLYSVDIIFVCYTIFFINMVYFLVSVSMFSFSASSYASDMLKVRYHCVTLTVMQRRIEGMFL